MRKNFNQAKDKKELFKEYLVRFYKAFKYYFLSNQNFRIFSVMFIVLLIGTILVLDSERKFNTSYDGLFNSIWWTIVTITTVGYGDMSPTTVTGRIIAMVMMFIGLSVVGIITGKITHLNKWRTIKRNDR